MKRVIIIIVCVLAIPAMMVLALLGLVFVHNYWYPDKDEREFRRSKYHTYGEIHVTIDGQKKNIDGMPVKFLYDPDRSETATINNGEFKIKKGRRGSNMYLFILPMSEEDKITEDIIVQVEYVNGSAWTVNDMLIDVNITTRPVLKASMSGYIKERTKGGGYSDFPFETEKEILEDGNILRVYISNI